MWEVGTHAMMIVDERSSTVTIHGSQVCPEQAAQYYFFKPGNETMQSKRK